MPCLRCNARLFKPTSPLCTRCKALEEMFREFAKDNPEAAYNWAITQALDLAGDITGVNPGDTFLEVEDGELGIRTVNKIKTTLARYIPPELKTDDEK